MAEQRAILVTGGAGFIGTHLCRRLAGLGHRVKVLDLKAPAQEVAGVRYVRGDVRDPGTVASLVAESDCVYHLAAIVSVAICQEEPEESYRTNLAGTGVVLACIEKERKKGHPVSIAFASTAAIYGTLGDHRRPLVEQEIASRFSSFYAAQKHGSEQMIALYRDTFGVPGMVFRFFNVYGPGQDPSSPYSGVISIFTRYLSEGKSPLLNAGGGQTRDFISVHDLVGACVTALDLPPEVWNAEPVNLGTGKTVTIRQLAERLVAASGRDNKLVDAPPRSGDVMHSCADISRARKLLAFEPRITLEEGLRELLAR